MMKTFLNLLLMLLFAFFVSCGNSEDISVQSKSTFVIDSELDSRLEYHTIYNRNVEYDIMLTGMVTYNQEKKFPYIPINEGQVLSVSFSLGDYVRKGQSLAVVRSGESAEAINDLIEAESELTLAKRAYQVAQELYKAGINSKTDYLIAEKDYKTAESRLAKIKEIIELYGGNTTKNQTIKAPASGYIVSRNINPGMHLKADGEPIFIISDLNDVWVEASVFESDLSKIQLGQNARIKILAYTDTVFYGRISHVSNILDPEDKTMKIRISLPNKDRNLKPGMFARVFVDYEITKQMPAVPTKALIFDRNKHFVVTVDDSKIPKLKEVNIFAQKGDTSYVSNGLSSGERIISKNQLLIYTAMSY